MSDLIAKAQIYCQAKHAFQKRKYSGEPYWIHPFQVATMVMEISWQGDIFVPAYDHMTRLSKEDIIVTALLHDVVEDTDATCLDIMSIFNEVVADGVYGLTNTSKIDAPNANRAARKKIDQEKIKKMPPWIRAIKYSDRWANLADTFDYVASWDIKQPFPEAGWFYKYIQESRDLLEVLNEVELRQEFGNTYFDKYNLNMLMDNLKLELDQVTQEIVS